MIRQSSTPDVLQRSLIISIQKCPFTKICPPCLHIVPASLGIGYHTTDTCLQRTHEHKLYEICRISKYQICMFHCNEYQRCLKQCWRFFCWKWPRWVLGFLDHIQLCRDVSKTVALWNKCPRSNQYAWHIGINFPRYCHIFSWENKKGITTIEAERKFDLHKGIKSIHF